MKQYNFKTINGWVKKLKENSDKVSALSDAHAAKYAAALAEMLAKANGKKIGWKAARAVKKEAVQELVRSYSAFTVARSRAKNGNGGNDDPPAVKRVKAYNSLVTKFDALADDQKAEFAKEVQSWAK